jgi:hypothetical protein
MKTRAKVLVVIAAVLLLGTSLFLSLPRLQMFIALKSAYSPEKAPWAYQVPVERTIEVVTPEALAAEQLSCGWFRFNAPWKIINAFESEHARAFVFDGQKTFIISLRPKDESIVKTLLGSDPEDAREMKQLLGEVNVASDFAVLDFCLGITPERAGWLSSSRKLTLVSAMLILKSAYTPLGNEIYRVHLPVLKGFQFGNPLTTEDIYVYLFDRDDRLFRMKFQAVSQAEIDAVLASIQMI